MKLNKKYIHSVVRQTIIWGFVFTFWFLLRNYGVEGVKSIPDPTFAQWIRILVVLAIAAGILFGSLSYLYDNRIFKKMSFGRVALLGTVSYLIAILIIAAFGAGVFSRVLDLQYDRGFFRAFISSKSGVLFVVYCFFVGFLVDIFKEINKKFGPGNLMRMIRGEFHNPKEDERIFMFLDLRSSTTYAEKLGHIKYSQLIQDCFLDLDVVEVFKAEIYQYVGDEVILSWNKETGLENGNCLRAYFSYINRLNARSAYYTKEYGFVPEFKAGINVGKITVAEVGEIKREIAFHGDVLNTASRIQGQCNELGEKLLISEALLKFLPETDSYTSKEVGNVLLKGKASKVVIYSINEN